MFYLKTNYLHLKNTLTTFPPTARIFAKAALFILFYFSPLLWREAGVEVFAQNKKIDSLLTLLKTEKVDTNRVKQLISLSSKYSYFNPDSSIFYATQAKKIAEKINNKKFLAISYEELGWNNSQLAYYPQAIDYYLKAIKLNEELGNNDEISITYGSIGIVYKDQGDFIKALDYFFKALKIADELGDKNLIGTWLGNVGIVYSDQANYPKALEYYFRALKIAEELGKKNHISAWVGNIGNVYYYRAGAQLGTDKKMADSLYNNALSYYFKALGMAEEIGNKIGIAGKLGNIANVYSDKGDYPKALEYYFKALKMNEELGRKNGIGIILGSIGSLYTEQKKFKDAYTYIYHALTLNDSIGSMDHLQIDYNYLSELYEKANIPLQDSLGGKLLSMEQMRLRSLYYYKRSIAIRDTVFNQENRKLLVQKEMNYEFDKKEIASKAIQERKDVVATAEKKRQQQVLLLVSSVLFLVFVFAGFIFRSLRITRKQKNIIELQKNEVSRQKDIADSQRIIAEELRKIAEKQKHIVEEKQKEIVDSIFYAKRIQTALLTSDEYIKNNLPAEYFIFFQPKDIVSGDFYWALRTPKTRQAGQGLFYIATADCTGHGVPGAFMSLLNISYLNENVIERGIRMPHKILNAQRTEIIKALNPPGSTAVSRDGMDCTLCAFDFEKMLLYFAAAYNPLWLLRCGELIEFKADKMPVGKYIEEIHSFSLQTIELQKGDIVYTFSDGYADQFGGPEEKKFKYKQLKELLLDIHHLSMKEQKLVLEKTINSWKGNLEQVDDILLIGVKV